MKSATIYIKSILLTFSLVIISLLSLAQKLPSEQNNSLRTPANRTIDGKATEWNNIFQAYDKNAEVFYTISNDDDKLYFTLQAVSPIIIKKIIRGGVTFSFNGAAKKEKAVRITYPMYDKINPPPAIAVVNVSSSGDDAQKEVEAVALMNKYNKQLQDKLKFIGVNGIESIKDSILSIYNPEGIRAQALFDNKIALTYECAVPLKYLGFDINNRSKIVFNIRLNSIHRGYKDIFINKTSAERLIGIGLDGKYTIFGLATPENLMLAFPTDFSGEYKLAR